MEQQCTTNARRRQGKIGLLYSAFSVGRLSFAIRNTCFADLNTTSNNQCWGPGLGSNSTPPPLRQLSSGNIVHSFKKSGFQRRLLSATSQKSRRRQTEFNLSLALLPLLLLGKLAVCDRCGKTFPPARTSYYVLADVSKSQFQDSFPLSSP